MVNEQKVPALIAGLIHAGVEPKVIEQAVAWACSIPLGRSVTGNDPLVRAFAFEQARLLERA